MRSLRLALIAGAAVVAWQAAAPAARTGAADDEARRSGRLARHFQPDRQTPVEASGFDLTVRLAATDRCAGCASGYRQTFEIADRANGAHRRVTLDGPAQVDDVRIVSRRRAVVLGQRQSSVGEVVLLDPESGTPVDRFLGLDPALSPDGQLVAYVKVFPLHFTPGVSAQYLLYDIRRPPSAHRQAGVQVPPQLLAAGAGNLIDVGIPVYPLGAANAPGDNVGLPDGAWHALRSPLFWSADSRRLAFSDWVNGSQWIVLVDLSGGTDHPVVKTQMLDTSTIVRAGAASCADYAGREADAFRVGRIDFLGGGSLALHLEFQAGCGGRESITVDLP